MEAHGVIGGAIAEATGLDDGEEPPADLALFLCGKLDRDDAGRKGSIEHGPEAFADAGGIYDEVLRMPRVGEVFELAEDSKMVLTLPGMAGYDAVGGTLKGFEGGEVNFYN